MLVQKQSPKSLLLTHARLLVAFLRLHKAHLTLAPKGTWIIDTLAVLAQARIVGTLVDVVASITITFKAGITLASKKNHME